MNIKTHTHTTRSSSSSVARFFGPSTSLASQSSLDIIKEDGDNELAAIAAVDDRNRRHRRRSSSLCRRVGVVGDQLMKAAAGGHHYHRKPLNERQHQGSSISGGGDGASGGGGGGGSDGVPNRDEYEDLSSIDDDHPWRPTDKQPSDGVLPDGEDTITRDVEEDGTSSGRTKGAQGWRNVRAVMAYYCTLRKIKRNVAFCNVGGRGEGVCFRCCRVVLPDVLWIFSCSNVLWKLSGFSLTHQIYIWVCVLYNCVHVIYGSLDGLNRLTFYLQIIVRNLSTQFFRLFRSSYLMLAQFSFV